MRAALGFGRPDYEMWVRRMQGEDLIRGQLFGSPYSGMGLGALLVPYDLGQPGRVAELKRVLYALGKAGADPFKKAPGAVITETTWQSVTDDDTWDGAAEDELVLAVSRYRGMGWQVPEPYVQKGPVVGGGGPQPAVNGLELLAGAANEALAGAVKMKLYEAWRKDGCALSATCFDPPSAISRPPTETVVVPTQNTGLRLALPASAPEAFHALVHVHDLQLENLWKAGLSSTTEAERQDVANALAQARAARTAVVTALLAEPAARSPQGTTQAPEETCKHIGGTWQPATELCRLPMPPPPGLTPKPPPPKSSPGLGTTEIAIVAAALVGIVLWARHSSGRAGRGR